MKAIVHLLDRAGESSHLRGSNVRPLLHDRPPVMPKAIVERQNALELGRLLDTGMRWLPLKGGHPVGWKGEIAG